MWSLPRIGRNACIIGLIGAAAALTGIALSNDLREPTIASFIEAYAKPDEARRMALSDEYLKAFSPSDLLSAIEEKYASSVCHTQGHAIGRSIYKKYGNFTEAIGRCGSACTYGCFHGVMMEMFATKSDSLGGAIDEQSPEAYLRKVEEEAADLCTKPEVASVVRARYCYHGLGHVFAYAAGEDLGQAVRSCEGLTSPHAVDTCQSGAFMEYLFSSVGTPHLNTKGTEPCDAYPDDTSECYRYKAYGWLKAWGGWEPALQSCQTMGERTLVCIRNLALAQASLELIVRDEDLDRLCGSLNGDEHAACIEGALLRVIELNDGDDSDRTCDVIVGRYREACVALLHRQQAF